MKAIPNQPLKTTRQTNKIYFRTVFPPMPYKQGTQQNYCPYSQLKKESPIIIPRSDISIHPSTDSLFMTKDNSSQWNAHK